MMIDFFYSRRNRKLKLGLWIYNNCSSLTLNEDNSLQEQKEQSEYYLSRNRAIAKNNRFENVKSGQRCLKSITYIFIRQIIINQILTTPYFFIIIFMKHIKINCVLLVAISLLILSTVSQVCPVGCSTCNATSCTGCNARYFALSTACPKCPDMCTTCTADNTSKPTCSACDSPAQLTPDNRMCYICSPVCLTCLQSPDNCDSCQAGTELIVVGTMNGKDIKTCRRKAGCMAPCKDCNGTVCSSCLNGLYLNIDICRPCKFPCKTCSDQTTCLTVVPGFRNQNGTAVKCRDRCLQCTNSSCTQCAFGNLINADSCDLCTSPCLTCSGAITTCTSCVPPYVLNAGSCVLCNPKCSQCASGTPNVCIKCFPPFSLIPTGAGACFRCTDFNCRTCQQAAPAMCIQCNVGFLVNSNKTCDKCPQYCNFCAPNTVNASRLECAQCSERSVITNDLKCMRCAQGCLKCSIINGTTTTCTKCADGGWNNQGNCMRCKQGCKTCDNGRQCTSFADGFIEIQGTMYRLRPGCKVGDLMNPEKCQQCSPGYFLDAGNFCKRCMKDCQICSNQAACTICMPRTVKDANNTCIRCNDVCLTCDPANKDTCKSCPVGSVLANNTCTSNCPKNCLVCDQTNSSICITQKPGFSVSQNNKIVRCLSSCGGKCNPKKPGQCLSAAFGYQLINGKSSKCPDGAVSCQNGKPSQCEDRYELKEVGGIFKCVQRCRVPCSECTEDDICTACMPNFIFDNANKMCNPDLTCNGTNNCVVCPLGSYRVGGGNTSCVACTVTNCASCSNTQCFECRQGFWFNPADSTCTACAANCQRCRDGTTCDACLKGFLKQSTSQDSTVSTSVFSNLCTACVSPCSTCFDQPTTCKSCIDGYRINGTICFSNISVGVRFTVKDGTYEQNSQQTEYCTSVTTALNKSDNKIVVNTITAGSTTLLRLLQTATSTVQSSISVDSTDSTATVAATTLATISSLYGTSLVSSSAVIENVDGTIISEASKNNTGLIVGVVVGGFCGLVILALIIYKVVKYRRQQNQPTNLNMNDTVQDAIQVK